MFIGRKKELDELEVLYSSDKFEFVVIYGRRRVGKTALINEFIKNKQAIYFMGVESNAKQNLENFSSAIMEEITELAAEVQFSSFQSALQYCFEKSINERRILVIDEYPYVAKTQVDFPSILQRLIDMYKDRSKLFLLLCGSSMSYMTDKVLAYKSPLYGRRTAQIKLEPFDFMEACKCFSNFSRLDMALIYGVAGGTPLYLQQMNDTLSVEENIKRAFLRPASILYEEPINLLKQEVREPALYMAIITAIAGGASRMSEISSKIGEENSICATYISNLVDLGIVCKETPYGEKASRKSIYTLSDNMFRFWYRFIPVNAALIGRNAIDLAYKRIEVHLPEYMGHIFEDICIQYMWNRLLNGDLPVMFYDIGRWWGTDSRTRQQIEIDMVAFEDDSKALFGECKWRNAPVEVDVLHTLIERSQLFRHSKKYYYIFSKSGFSVECKNMANSMGNVFLISYDDMF